ncbi:MAG: hypothetical protein RIR31_252, partial [Bacteroidota bacterium]
GLQNAAGKILLPIFAANNYNK